MICIYCAQELGLGQQYYHKCKAMERAGAESPLSLSTTKVADLKRDYRDVEHDLDAARKATNDYMEKQVHDQFIGEIRSRSVHHAPLDLTIDKLTEMHDQIKRYDHIYIMESNHIPDDAIGVLWVRPQDARRIKK